MDNHTPFCRLSGGFFCGRGFGHFRCGGGPQTEIVLLLNVILQSLEQGGIPLVRQVTDLIVGVIKLQEIILTLERGGDVDVTGAV